MSKRGNSGFTDIDKRFGNLTGETKGIVEVRQHYLERRQGRFDVQVPVTLTGSTQLGSGTTNVETAPVEGFFDFSWAGMIYTSSELDTDVSGPKTLTGLAFDVDSFSSRQGENFTDVRVFCAHFSGATFTETNADEDIENRSGISDWLQCTNNGYTWLPETVGINIGERIIFDTPFEYNGTDYLMIKIEQREGMWENQPRILWDTSTVTDSVANDRADNTYPTGAGEVTNSNRPNTVVYYEYTE